MGITRDEFDGVDLIGNDRLWLEDDGVGAAAEYEIVATPRINVQYAEEWSAKVRKRSSPPPPQ
jgi:3-methyladenine DNA glycosylase Mpg